MPDCTTCLPINCDALVDDDQRLYSLDRVIYPFVGVCPQGYDCNAIERVQMLCCDRLIAANFPPGSTLQQRQDILQEVYNQCLRMRAFCGEEPPTSPPTTPGAPNPPIQFFYNEAQRGTFNCGDGGVYTFVQRAGTFAAPTQSQANILAINAANENALLFHFCVPGPMCMCVDGGSTTGTLRAFGNPKQLRWTVTGGVFPSGMSITNATGNTLTISGTPPNGAGTFQITVYDGVGGYLVKTVTWEIIEITPTTLPSFGEGVAYSEQLTASGGTGSFTWSITSGSLPSGLSLSASGLISGTPTSSVGATFTVRASDGVCSCTQEYTLASSGCAGWTPATLTTRLQAWFRPEALGAYADGASLTTWTDNSAYGNNATIRDAGNPISVRTNKIGGLRTVELHSPGAGQTDFGFSLLNPITILGGQDFAVFAVGKFSLNAFPYSTGMAPASGALGAITAAVWSFGTSSISMYVTDDAAASAAGDTGITVGNTYAAFEWVGNTTGTVNLFSTGMAAAGVDVAGPGGDLTFDYIGSVHFGWLSEVIIVKGAMSPTERANMRCYLEDKYSLPYTSPVPSSEWSTDYLSGLVNNDPVPAWTDNSGSGNIALNTNALTQPIYKTNQINSLPLVSFKNGGLFLDITNQLNTSRTTFTMFVVANCNFGSDAFVPMGSATQGAGLYGDGATIGVYNLTNIQPGAPYSAAWAGSNGSIIFEIAVGDDAMVAYRSTGMVADDVGGPWAQWSSFFAMAFESIGRMEPDATFPGTVYYFGDNLGGGSKLTDPGIAHISLYSERLSDADRDTIRAALQAKYNIPP